MERDELRTTLVNHLETLRRNLQVVSMEVLKTKYKNCLLYTSPSPRDA